MRPGRAACAMGLAVMLLAPSLATAQDAATTPENEFVDLVIASEVLAPDDAQPAYDATIVGPDGTIPVSQAAIEAQTEFTVPARDATYVFTLSDPGPDWAVTDISCEADGVATVDIPNRTATLALGADDILGGCLFEIGSGMVDLIVERDPEEGPISPSAVIVREDGDQQSVPGLDLVPPGLVGERFPPGVHVATLEDPGPDWVVTAVDCVEADEERFSDGVVATREATLGVDAGDRVSCIYEVGKRGRVTIKVRTEPKGLENKHWYTVEELEGESTLARGNRDGKSYDLRPGISRAILQDPGDRWTLTAIDCRDRDTTTASSGDVDAMTAELGVDANDKITCTFKLRDETVPSAGLWRVVETSASGECNDQPVEIKTGQTQRYRLSVSNKGQRLEGTGRGGSIRMNRARSDDGRYTGKARIANARWQVRSHDRIVGSNTIKEGKCTFVRNFDMRLIRD